MSEGVPGVRIHGVQGRLTGGQVVGMTGIDEAQIPLGRLGHDALRADLADHTADVAAEVEGRLHPAVGVAEEPHVAHPHHCRSGPLFVLAQRRHLGP